MAHPRVVVLSEDNFTGHRWMYVELLLRSAAKRGQQVHLLTVPDALDAGRKGLAVSMGAIVETRGDDSFATLADYAEHVGGDLVLVPDADARAIALGRGARWPSTTPLRLLVMRAHAQSHGSAIGLVGRELVRRGLLLIAARRRRVDVKILCSGVMVDPPANRVPDPVEFAPGDEPPLQLDPDFTWLGILGAVDERKNPLLVLDAAALAAGRTGRKFALLVAGRVDEALLPKLKAYRGPVRLELLNRRLSDPELDALVRAVDITVQAHDNDSPSGILAKSAVAGTRILAGGSGVLRRDCRDIGDGAQWRELTAHDLAGGIVALVEGPAPVPRPLSEVPFCERLLG